MAADFYVYVYIDPRNNEEFYYGKGNGYRKNAHLADKADSEKTRRIAAIQREHLQPIIRVIARGLSEAEALLVEKTLLWKLGKGTTNVATGHYAEKFRPHDTLHKEISGFDYKKGIYYFNVGEGKHRNWDDYTRYGFISGGQGARWRDAMRRFNLGDVCVAYLKGRGFVGVGKITAQAEMVRQVRINGQPLLALPLRCRNMGENGDDSVKSEYVCIVQWIRTFARSKARWKSKSGLYTTTLVRASLDRQPATIEFVDKEFDVSLRDLACSDSETPELQPNTE